MPAAWRFVAFLWLVYVINYVDRQVVFSIFPALRQDLGFTDTSLGLIGAVFTWVYSLSMPLAGRTADMLRRDRVILSGLLLWSAATLGTGLSRTVGEFLVWRGVMGVTESLYMPAALSLIAGLHPGATRSKALATHATAQFAGILVGGWLGGWMADHVGWRNGFFALACAGILYAMVLARAFRSLPPISAAESRVAAAPLDIFRSRSFLALLAAFFMFCTMLWILYAWLPGFIYDRYHLSMTQSGLTATLYLQSGSAVGVLLGGILGDRFAKRVPGGRFYVGGAGLVLCAPCAWLVFSTHSLVALSIFAAAFGLTSGLFVANLFASAYDVMAAKNYGFGAGTMNMIGGLAGGIGIFSAGLWRASVGVAGVIQWGAAGTALTAVIMIIIVFKTFRADRERALGYQ